MCAVIKELFQHSHRVVTCKASRICADESNPHLLGLGNIKVPALVHMLRGKFLANSHCYTLLKKTIVLLNMSWTSSFPKRHHDAFPLRQQADSPCRTPGRHAKEQRLEIHYRTRARTRQWLNHRENAPLAARSGDARLDVKETHLYRSMTIDEVMRAGRIGVQENFCRRSRRAL